MKKQTFTPKAILVVLLVILFASPAMIYGQKKPKKKQTDDDGKHDWDYTILRNSPDDVSPFTIKLDPFQFGLFSNGLYGGGLGATVGADLNITENLEISGNFAYYYFNLGEGGYNEFLPAAKIPNYGLEIGGAYFFSNRSVNADETVLLYSESGGYRTIINHITKIALDHQQKFGVRVGYGAMNNNFRPLAGGFQAYDVSDPMQRTIDLSNSTVQTYNHIGYFWLGLTSEKIREYKLKFQNGVERKNARKVTWYADFLVAPFSTYDNVNSALFSSGGDTIKTYNIDKYSAKSLFGFRIGIDMNTLLPFGIRYGFEGGALPGSLNSQFYFIVKWGFDFNANKDN